MPRVRPSVKSIGQGNVTDIGKSGADVVVPKGGLAEPTIRHGKGGVIHRVLPGNNNENARFRTGDRKEKPKNGGGGSGSQSNEDGEGEDSFVYHLSEKEFLDLLFDDLELPNMFKLGADDQQKTTLEHAGFSSTGPFNRLNLIRSKQEKTKRELVMNKRSNERLLELLSEQKTILSQHGQDFNACATRDVSLSDLSVKGKIKQLKVEIQDLKEVFVALAEHPDTARLEEIDRETAELNAKIGFNRKWREKQDLRFRAVEEEPLPTSKAVMFCEMDVSGSVTEEMKSNSKLFYFLLHRFLQRQYDQVDIVFIRYHSNAKEVNEQEFFGGSDTGGTVVSKAHEQLLDIQQARYPAGEWNIYGAQSSDGDNVTSDNPKTLALMKKILPLMQGFFYIDVGGADNGTDLWEPYKALADGFKDRFWMQKVKSRKDVWPVFHEMFKKRQPSGAEMQPRSAAFGPR